MTTLHEAAMRKALKTLEDGDIMCEVMAANTLRSALEAKPTACLNAEAAFISRSEIDDTAYDLVSFLTGYEQGKYDEEMRQGPNFTTPTPEPGDREALIAKLRNGYQGIQLGAEGMGWGFDIDTLMKVADMLESDAPFEPDWVNYKQGFAAGKAEAIPDGYVLVPIEPTPEMRSACKSCFTLDQIWSALLSAAPRGEA